MAQDNRIYLRRLIQACCEHAYFSPVGPSLLGACLFFAGHGAQIGPGPKPGPSQARGPGPNRAQADDFSF